MALKTKLLKYLSEKQTFCTMGGRLGRLLLGSHADGSRKMYEVHVSGFAISSDESPEKCELTGSSKRKFKREMDC